MQDIIALTRPASMSKPANVAIKERGVELRPLDLKASQETIVAALTDIDILISAIGPMDQLEQIPLATAAKTAAVRRFLPCAAITVIPVGIHRIRDQKEEVYNHVKRLGLSYTIVDVGWWYQISFPSLPSGKVDYAVGIPNQKIPGDGTQGSALTDLRDIGQYMAKIVQDERTVDKYVLVYNEIWSVNQVYDAMERLSGEKLERRYDSREMLEDRINDAEAKIKSNPELISDFGVMLQQVGSQYLLSWGIRGDNTPEYAKYLGYVTSKDLYPDMNFVAYEDYLKEVLDGKAKPVYEELKAAFANSSASLQQ